MRAEERLALVMLAGACAVAGCHARGAAPEPERRTVRCARVETTDVTDALELRGTVAPLPDRDAQVAPQVAGRIVQLLAREGDRVTAGQPVARVDDSVLVDQASEAQAALEKTRAERRNADATHARDRAGVRARNRRPPGGRRRRHARRHRARRRERGRGASRSGRGDRSTAPPCAARSPASWSACSAAPASWSTARPRRRSSRSPIPASWSWCRMRRRPTSSGSRRARTPT